MLGEEKVLKEIKKGRRDESKKRKRSSDIMKMKN